MNNSSARYRKQRKAKKDSGKVSKSFWKRKKKKRQCGWARYKNLPVDYGWLTVKKCGSVKKIYEGSHDRSHGRSHD